MPKPFSTEMREKIKKLHEGGMSVNSIKKKLGISHYGVSHTLDRFWEAEHKQTPRLELATSTQSESNPTGMDWTRQKKGKRGTYTTEQRIRMAELLDGGISSEKLAHIVGCHPTVIYRSVKKVRHLVRTSVQQSKSPPPPQVLAINDQKVEELRKELDYQLLSKEMLIKGYKERFLKECKEAS